MKKIAFIILFILPAFSFAQNKFKITGTLTNAKDQQMIWLNYIDIDGKSTTDSAKMINGKFVFKGQTAFGNKATLRLRSNYGSQKAADVKEFYLAAGKTTVRGSDNLNKSIITGTSSQAEYTVYHTAMDPLQDQYKLIVDRYYKAKAKADSSELKNIATEARPLMAKMDSTLNAFIGHNPDSYVAADLILSKKMTVVDPQKFEPIYASLGKNVLESFTGKKITEKYDKAKLMAIGMEVDFVLPDTAGNSFSLASLRGKYVLVDFWASWCVPCRAENPHLLQAYEKLKDSGFDIVSISLDDKREWWLKAVEGDKLPWQQVSDLKGFKTEIALRFGITAIPQNFLLNPEGKIIAKDLRGEGLTQKIANYIR